MDLWTTLSWVRDFAFLLGRWNFGFHLVPSMTVGKRIASFFLPQGGTVTKLKCIMMFIWCRNDECVFHFRCGVDLLLCHFHTSSIIRCAIRLLQNWGPCLFTSILTGCANFSSRSRVHTCWVDSLISRVPNLKIILGKPLEIDGFWT